MKLNVKFLIIFLLISNIPIIIITLFTYDRYTKLVNEQTSQVSENVFQNAIKDANNTIDNIKHMSEIFQFYSETNDSIIEDLKKYTKNDGSYTTYDLFKSRNNMMFICKNLIYANDYINGIFIFTPSGENISYGYGDNIDISHGYKPFESQWYKETLLQKGSIYISGISTKPFIINSKPSISFSTALYDVYSHEFLGVLLVDCSPDVFDLSRANTLPNTTMLAIENSEGDILYSNIDTMKTTFTKKNTKVMKAELDIEGLSLIAAINYEQLYNEFGFTRIIIIVIAIVCALLFIIISIFLSQYLTKPITHLSNKISSRNGFNLETSKRYLDRTDEIGILYNEYNCMIKELAQLIKNEYTNKLITLDSQMKSLEAQINSHFLYNTLESINSIAEIEEVESISTMSLALGNMFRYSIKTKSELVTVAEELQHVNNYISIQKIRFDNKFDLILDLSQGIREQKVLKLILQPIVENALLHGLQYCSTGRTIKIRGYRTDLLLIFQISDDGIGMSIEQLHEIQDKFAQEAHFTELGQRNNQSIGLKNIHSRIELYYGQGYGLSIESKEMIGTTITIKLPILREKEL